MWKRIGIVFGVVFIVPLLWAQVGPTVFTPRLTVSPGPLTVSTGLTTVQDLTINGTCTGCPSTTPGGANTQVQYNNAGAFGGDAGFTYVAATDTASIGVVRAGDGAVGAPSYSFTSDTDTGLFWSTANSFNFVAGGATVGFFNGSGLRVSGGSPMQLRAPAATSLMEITDSTGATILSQTGESAGTYIIAKNSAGGIQLTTTNGGISFVPTGGTISLSGAAVFTSTIRGAGGDATAPAFSFSSDTDTGLFNTTNVLGITTAGTARYLIGASGEMGIGATPDNGTSGQVFTSGGTGSPPTWTTPLAETSGTFTATFDDGCTTSPTVAFRYRKIGTVVTLRWDNMSPTTCTSDSITFDTNSLGEVPADIRPSSTQSSIFMPVIDNSVARSGEVSVSASGNIQMRLCIAEGGAATGLVCSTNLWTNANLKSIQAGEMVYSTTW